MKRVLGGLVMAMMALATAGGCSQHGSTRSWSGPRGSADADALRPQVSEGVSGDQNCSWMEAYTGNDLCR
ncbi:MAG: hypothetical protein GXY33_16435 [Phycisphaerae bacterium]|nr:hypothetical protein [Phycisphaerae bacterium]